MNHALKVLMTLSAFALASTAHAGGQELRQFFRALDTSWEGQGIRRVLQANGSVLENKTQVEISFDGQSEDSDSATWLSRSEVTLNTGIVEYGSNNFRVENDLLFIGTYSPSEPVTVTRSTADGVTYQFQRFQPLTGRVFQFTVTLQLAGPKELRGSTVVTLNGVQISEDRYDVTSW